MNTILHQKSVLVAKTNRRPLSLNHKYHSDHLKHIVETHTDMQRGGDGNPKNPGTQRQQEEQATSNALRRQHTDDDLTLRIQLKTGSTSPTLPTLPMVNKAQPQPTTRKQLTAIRAAPSLRSISEPKDGGAVSMQTAASFKAKLYRQLCLPMPKLSKREMRQQSITQNLKCIDAKSEMETIRNLIQQSRSPNSKEDAAIFREFVAKEKLVIDR
jgi:hypothetical protein